MRGVYIIVEGLTESEFVNECLAPYFHLHGLYDVRPISLQTSPGHKGGDIKFDRFKWNAGVILKREKDILLTSLIDFYRLYKDFPAFQESKGIADVQERIAFLGNAVKEQISHDRFLPYIQLHEFEGLLFADKKGFNYLPDVPEDNKRELERIIDENPNPELINEGENTAPSKRLKKLIPGYQKPLHGPIMAIEIGVPILRQKCPRFNLWVEKIIAYCKPAAS